MLKLIYSLSEKEITLKYERRKKFWSKKLLAALSISFGVHLLMVGLFSIQSLKPKREVILKPSRVSAEIKAFLPLMSQLLIDDYGFIQNNAYLAKTSHFSSENASKIDAPTLFDEKDILEGFDYTFPSHESFRKKTPLPQLEVYKTILPVQIQLSSSLIDQALLKPMKPKKVRIGQSETLQCHFLVEVDPRHGKIYYSEMLTSTGFYKYDQYAKRLLKELKFKKRSSGSILKGELSFFIDADKRELYDSY